MPQSNSNLQSYAKLPAAKNNSPKIPQISQNISLRLSLMPHTDSTRFNKNNLCELWKSEYSEHSEYSDTLHDPSANLCEI